MAHPMNEGFTATIAVVLLASGTLAFSLATMSAAAAYADSVYRRELRIQAGLYADSCLETAELMAAKDYFLDGSVDLPEFFCAAMVENSFAGSAAIEATSTLGGVSAHSSAMIAI
ncbi:MAG: hypothetical protein KGI45_00070 [Patescibacteria group bacterium]|nr:hypothetical protein [Patescibacteria group bacterium]